MNTTLQAIVAGQLEAMDECLARYGDLVWRLVRRSLRVHQDAEDLVQEIFTDLWRSASRFDPERGSETAFVLTIARRRLIDRLRKQGRRAETDGAHPLEEIPGEAEPDRLEIDEEVRRIRVAMATLRPEQQRVLEMALLEGRSHSQIADRTGLPLGTVKTHARRGLLKLRETLGLHPREQSPEPATRVPA